MLEIGARTPTLAYCQAVCGYQRVEGTRATWETNMPSRIKDKEGREYSFVFHTFDIGLGGEFPLPEGEFDCVICTEVIEHIVFDPAKGLLDQIKRILKPGGILLLSTPNLSSLDALLRMTRNETPMMHPVFTEVGWLEHPKEYAPHELRKKIESVGFECLTLTTIAEPYEQGSTMNAAKTFLQSTGYDFELGNRFTLIVAQTR